MTWQNEAKCLITGAPAQEALPQDGDFIELITESHGRYRVSRSAIPRLEKLDGDARLHALKQAQKEAKAGEIPMITTYNL